MPLPENAAPISADSDRGRQEHFVQFYHGDHFLIESISVFIRAGFERGEACLVIAGPQHLQAVETSLRAAGLDLDSLSVEGLWNPKDARETLSRFLVNGFPDESRFQEVIGGVLGRLIDGGRNVRAFGEMVALLWAEGKSEAAMELERLWNRLGQTYSFTLFCAYPLKSFAGEQDAIGFRHVCREHSRVIPAETYFPEEIPVDGEGIRAFALMQQKTLALEAEIAKREKIEADLRRSKEQLTRYLETASIGLRWMDADGTILWANDADFEYLGYRREEYVGHNIAEFHADQTVVNDILVKLRAGERVKNFEARLICKDGSQRSVLIDSSVLWDEKRFLHTQCFTRDITLQKQAGIQNRRLAAIVESSLDGIIGKDTKSIITTWNKAAERIFGYTAEEVIGKHITVLFPPDRVSEENAILARVLSGEGIKHYETVRCRKDGTLIDISLSVSSIKDETGKVVGASKIVRDITEQKKFAMALAESERRFRDMADSAPVFIWTAGTTGIIDYVNRPYLEFTGRSIEEEAGIGWTEKIHPEDVKKCFDEFTRALRERAGFRMEFRLRRYDGAYRWMLDTGTPRVSPDGTLLGFIGSCIDINELKEAEDLLRHSQKMEAVGKLAGGIAHDFNNLLTAINGFTQLALDLEQGSAALPEFLAEIKKAGERAASLTQQLLAYSRKQMMSPRVFNLNLVVADMDKLLRRVIGEDIELKTILEAELPAIKADSSQVGQVIMNLVINARDAMPKGGLLILETSSVTLPSGYQATHLETAAGSYVMLRVSDSGHGMEKKIMNRIFEPFFTTKEVGKGTGLGLASVYGIVKQSGGGISVESEPGRGSAFMIYLPAVPIEKLPAPDAPRSISKKTERRAETILIAEDEEAVRRLLSLTLMMQGYTVLEARNGEEAMALAEKNGTIDLLITDVIMPKMNGVELAEKLREGLQGLKTLYISGYTSNFVEKEKIQGSAAGFLQKPFSPTELLNKVRELIEQNSKALSA